MTDDKRDKTDSSSDSAPKARETKGTERVKYETITLGGDSGILNADTGIINEGESSTAITKTVTDKMLRTGGLSEKYVFLDEIGRGGMGSVLRVYDSNLRRHVAMKRILASSSDRTRLRFVEEAQITGQLEHPHIVPVHEIGRDTNGRLYFTMKLVRGETLHDILDSLREDPTASERYSLGHLLHAYINVCHAIDFAHARDVIHRDIKPENIMLGQFGEVQVMDWGLAKARRVDKESVTQEHVREAVTVERQEQAESLKKQETKRVATIEDGITMDGQILGTLAYMSPEQARGDNDNVNKRSDIYTLGAILYEILTLQIPVNGKSNEDMIRQICRGNIVVPSERTPDRSIQKELEAIAMKALARVPELRYQSVYELRLDVERYISGRSVSAKKDSFVESVSKLVMRNKAVSFVAVVSLISIVFLAMFTAQERRKANENKEKTDQLEKVAIEESRRDWVEVHPEQFNLSQLPQHWDLYTDWSVPPVPVEEHQLSRFVGADPDGMHVRTDDKQLTILFREPIVGDVKLRYEATWLGGSEGGFHAILHGNGWHEGYVFQIGGWGNTKTRLLRADSDGQTVLAESDFTLTVNTLYQIEATKIGNELNLFINGELILHAVEEREDVLAGGPYSHCGFVSGNNAESIYHNVSISKLGESMRVDILDVADRYMLKAQYQTAHDLYHEVFESLTSSERKQRARSGVERANEYLKLEGMLDTYERKLSRVLKDYDPKLWIERKAIQLDMRGKDVDDISVLKGMSIQRLNIAGCKKVQSIAALAGMPLYWLDISQTGVRDISFLRESPVTYLNLDNCPIKQGWVVLRKLPLEYLSMQNQDIRHLSALSTNTTLEQLDVSDCKIRDLSTLVNKPLIKLRIAGNPVSDIQVLAQLGIRELDMSRTQIKDLETLRLMPQVQTLSLSHTQVSELGPLVHCDLFKLDIAHTQVRDLSPIKTLYLKELHIQGTEIDDLTPLADMQLETVRFTPVAINRGMDVLRDMDSLEFIAIDDGPLQAAADFWTLWDLQESELPDFEKSMIEDVSPDPDGQQD